MIDRYEQIEKIGSGGMGVVYRALDTELNREVALKLLSPQIHTSKQFVDLFRQEAKIVSQLAHPHIIPIYDSGIDEKRPYFVMKLLRGGTLQDKLNQGNLTMSQLWPILKQVAQALDYAHSQGVVHQDVKPTNILFDEREMAVLSDFGLANIFTSTHPTGNISAGTPIYMSPELCADEKIDGRSDQYGLAVVIFEALTGEPPFTGTNLQIMYKHVNAPPPIAHHINNQLPQTVSQIVQKGMSKSPTDRFATVNAFVGALITATYPEEADISLLATKTSESQTSPALISMKQPSINTDIKSISKALPHSTLTSDPATTSSSLQLDSPHIVAGAGGETNPKRSFHSLSRRTLLPLFFLAIMAIAFLIWPKAAANNALIEGLASPTIPDMEYVTLEIAGGAGSAVWNSGNSATKLAGMEQLEILVNGQSSTIQSNDGLLQLRFPNETELYLAKNTTIELHTKDELEIVLQQGKLLLQTEQRFTIVNQYGATASSTNGLLGITFSQTPFRFDVDCLIGSCLITGDLQGEQKLLATQHSYVGGNGRPSFPNPARYEQYVSLSPLVPTQTPTNIPTQTMLPTKTPTKRPSSTPINTTTPEPTHTNTPVPTMTPIPVQPSNTPAPVVPTQPSTPSATFLSDNLLQQCQWHVRILLAGFSPNSTITVTSNYSETECATGTGITSSWTQPYHIKTDRNGSLIFSILHQGTGSYTYTFTDETGKQATLSFETTP